ncbi:callose synthase 2-like [Eutrema salsugineum]|uniref:callose synthase 2-like n=1 Tax=Eutrema salsugineum TaxID=72664 RepID=UPI000CED57BF|nr:callose synthase 2-like [Eutrema salsugineum]
MVLLIMMIGVEKGLHEALFDIVLMQLQFALVFFTFQHGKKAHYYGRFYSRSHFIKAFQLTVLLLIYHMFGFTHLFITFSMWFMVGSWLFAPFLFNPSGFEWHKIFEDWKDGTKWVYAHDFEGMGVRIEKTSRFFIVHYGLVYQLTAFEDNHSIWVYVASLLIVVMIMLIVTAVIGQGKSRQDKLTLWVQDSQSCCFPRTLGKLHCHRSLGKLQRHLHLPSGIHLHRMGSNTYCTSLQAFKSTSRALVIEIQTGVLFNQAFSRGLKVSHILSGKSSAYKMD